MRFTSKYRNYILIGILWTTVVSLLLPSSILSVNRVVDVSLFNYVLGCNGGTHVVTTSIEGDGFHPDLLTVTVDLGALIDLGFYAADNTYTVTCPSPPFNVISSTILEGESFTATAIIDCPTLLNKGFPIGGSNGRNFVMTVTVVQCPTEPVGGLIVSNAMLKLIPAIMLFCLVFIAISLRKKN